MVDSLKQERTAILFSKPSASSYYFCRQPGETLIQYLVKIPKGLLRRYPQALDNERQGFIIFNYPSQTPEMVQLSKTSMVTRVFSWRVGVCLRQTHILSTVLFWRSQKQIARGHSSRNPNSHLIKWIGQKKSKNLLLAKQKT